MIRCLSRMILKRLDEKHFFPVYCSLGLDVCCVHLFFDTIEDGNDRISLACWGIVFCMPFIDSHFHIVFG